MDLLNLIDHLLNLLLPGVGTGFLAAALAKLLWRRDLAGVSYWRLAFCAALASAAVCVAGLAVFGHDGRMLTYLFMVGGCGLALAWGGWTKRPQA